MSELAFEALLERLSPGISATWQPASEAEIARLEQLSGCPLPAFYRWFLSRMGSSMGRLEHPRWDFGVATVLASYERRKILPHPHFLLVARQREEDVMEFNLFYDLREPARGDARVRLREPGDPDALEDGFETLREMLASTAAMDYFVIPAPFRYGGAVIDRDRRQAEKLGELLRAAGFSEAIPGGRCCGIYTRDDMLFVHTGATPPHLALPPPARADAEAHDRHSRRHVRRGLRMIWSPCEMPDRRPDPPGDHADVAAGRTDSIPATRSIEPPAAEPHTSPTRPAARRPSNSRPPLDVGTKLGRYVILERLGAGGLGVVYKAYDPELDRRLAIKIVRMSSSRSSDAAATQTRFLREAQALAQLNHPNVLAVHDVGVVDDEVFIAMELVEGQTFKDWQRAQPRARQEVLSILLAAGRGLSAAHRAGLVHRDFKPSNVLIGDDQRVRVIDFGLARAADEPGSTETAPSRRDVPDPIIHASTGGHSSDRLLSSQLTLAGTIMGTPGYMAPEQYEGDALNPRTDQFAFCVTLFEAMCGRRPFFVKSQAELAHAIASGAIEPVLEDARVPKWIRRIVLRGLSARPEARYPSMDALLEALSRDPAARARRLAAAGGLAIAVAAATFAFAHLSAQPNEVCQGAASSMRTAWNAQRGGKLRAAFVATGRGHASATADRVIEQLDLHAEQWVAMYTDTCKATHVRGEQSPALLDLRMNCLRRRRSELAALASLLGERADADVVDHAVEAVVGLPSLALCADDRALTMGQPLPTSLTGRIAIEQLEGRLDEINALRSAGGYKASLGLAEQLVREAAPLGYASLDARAQLTLARLQQSAGDPRAAELALRATILAAAAARDDQLLAHGWLELYWVVAYMQARQDAADLLRMSAQAAIARAGDAPALRGQLVNSDASMSYLHGDYAKARGQFQEALSYRQQTNDGLEIAAAYNNIGLTYYKEGNYAQAIAFQQRALELRERILGPEHPTVVSSLNNLGIALERTGDRGRARMYYERALAIREGIYGPDHPSLAGLINNIGNILFLEGDLEGATRHLERALALKEAALGLNHPSVSVTLDSLGSVMVARQDYERARQLFARSLAMSEAPDHPNAAYALTGLGESLIALGRPQDAIAHLERALRVRTTQAVDVADIGETRLQLARALWAAGRDRAQALGLARVARDELARGGPTASKTLAVAEAWLAEHAPPR